MLAVIGFYFYAQDGFDLSLLPVPESVVTGRDLSYPTAGLSRDVCHDLRWLQQPMLAGQCHDG